MPEHSVRTEDPIVTRLRLIARETPELSEAAALYEAILPLLRDADLDEGMIVMTPEQAREKLEKGRPLLSDLDLDLDVEAVRELMIMLAAAVEKAGRKRRSSAFRLPWFSQTGEHGSAAARIRIDLEQGRVDCGSLLPSVAAGEHGPVTAAARDRQLDPALLLALAQNALKPALREWSSRLAPLAKEVAWNKGTCFVCGAPAALAELQGNNQERHLRCGSCGADWTVRRLECALCGSEDHRRLRILSDEAGNERMRVEACDACKGYLKVISAFSPTPAEMLAVEDLATLPLDYIARNAGYTRPHSSGITEEQK